MKDKFAQCAHCKGWIDTTKRFATGIVQGCWHVFHADFCIEQVLAVNIQYHNMDQKNANVLR